MFTTPHDMSRRHFMSHLAGAAALTAPATAAALPLTFAATTAAFLLAVSGRWHIRCCRDVVGLDLVVGFGHGEQDQN